MSEALLGYSEWVNNRLRDDPERDMFISALGLAGESGEVIEPIKKHLRDGRAINRQEMLLELGDVLYYLTRLSDLFGYDLAQVAAANIAKLTKRDAERESRKPA